MQAPYNDTKMLIGLISDTHIPEAEEKLPPEVKEAFRGVDLILHAGDIYERAVLDDLERIAPVLAARGDDDHLSTLTDKRVQEKHVLELGGKTIWLVHERAYYIVSSWWKNRIITGEDRNDLPDIVVFGHEHRTVIQNLHDLLFVSPGSPTFLGYQRGLGTVGILELGSGRADARIVQL